MENFRIESLEINKIGAFEHIKMDFPKKTDPDKAEIHILTGENGTGKSTVLEVLASCADDSNEKRLYKKFRNEEGKTGFQVKVKNHGEKAIYSKFINDFDSSSQQFQTSIGGYRPFTVVSRAFFAYSGNRFTREELINESSLVIDNPFQNALDFSKSIDSKQLSTWILSNKTKALIANSNGESESKNIYEKNIQKIENVISEIIGQEIKFILQTRPIIYVAVKLNGVQLSIDVLPDGIKSIISWLGDLIRRLETMIWVEIPNKDADIFERNIILFLDEIEVHLHPAWQRKILPVVQKLFKNAQIFISTHSPFVVGSVDGAWVHKLKKDGAYAVLDGKPVLSEDAESYDTILEEIFGIKERFGDEIELKLKEFKAITKEILKGDDLRMEEWDNLVSFFENQGRPNEIMSLITPQVRQINRIKNQVTA